MIGLMTSVHAAPDVYKYVDEHGNVSYSNKPNGGKKIDLPMISTVDNTAPSYVAPPANSSGNSGSNNMTNIVNPASGSKRIILEEELKKERELLAKAEAELASQTQIRLGNEKNPLKKDERLLPFKETVEQHKNNIKSLEIELNGK